MRQFGPPSSPPPAFIPSQPNTLYIIDCMYSFAYIWPNIGRPFWFYPTRVEYGEVSGYIWNGRSWTFYGFDPEIINAIACYPVPTLY